MAACSLTSADDVGVGRPVPLTSADDVGVGRPVDEGEAAEDRQVKAREAIETQILPNAEQVHAAFAPRAGIVQQGHEARPPDGEEPVGPGDVPARQEERQHPVHEAVGPGGESRLRVTFVEGDVNAVVTSPLHGSPEAQHQLEEEDAASHQQVHGYARLQGAVVQEFHACPQSASKHTTG